MGDAALRRALHDAMPRISRTLRELGERVDRLEGKDPGEAAVERVRGLWKGVWQEGTRYASGSLVTDKGSLWHCNEPSFDRPGTSSAWTLAVKRGRAGSLETD